MPRMMKMLKLMMMILLVDHCNVPEECFVLCFIHLLKICEPFLRRFGFYMPNATISDGALLMHKTNPVDIT